MIAAYGTGVAGAMPIDALKTIADRDDSVRDVALTETYFQEGGELFKIIGNLPEKVSYSR